MELKIGEFARLAQVSVQTLRYYDSINLLKPEGVDQFTSYRYYDLGQLSQLNTILAYKDLGFSLDQIAVFVHQKPSANCLNCAGTNSKERSMLSLSVLKKLKLAWPCSIQTRGFHQPRS